MAGLNIGSEVRRHLRDGEWQEGFDTLAHEGLKRSVESVIGCAASSQIGREFLTRLSGSDWTDDRLQTELGGMQLDGPTGIGAGWDKTGNSILAWQAMGANHITVGGVPLYQQDGNPMPRLFTFDRSFGDHGKAVSLNRYGFYSPGADAVVRNIYWQRTALSVAVTIPVGVQVTVNKELYGLERQAEIPKRLAETVKRVLPVADFISLGLSSPNTPGMRSMQDDPVFLAACMDAARQAASDSSRHVELFYKADGDGGEERLGRICQLIGSVGLDGIELINTTNIPAIKARYGASEQAGGLAGADPAYQALAVRSVVFARDELDASKKVHGMGGIDSARQNTLMLAAGADVTSINSYIRKGGRRAITNVERGVPLFMGRLGVTSLAELTELDLATVAVA